MSHGDSSTPLRSSASTHKAAYSASVGPVMQAVLDAVDAAGPSIRAEQTRIVISNLRGRCLSDDYTLEDYEREFGLR